MSRFYKKGGFFIKHIKILELHGYRKILNKIVHKWNIIIVTVNFSDYYRTKLSKVVFIILVSLFTFLQAESSHNQTFIFDEILFIVIKVLNKLEN